MTKIKLELLSCKSVYLEVGMKPYMEKKSAMCCAIGKKRMTAALRACDYCTTSMYERSACYKAVAKDTGLRSKACILM